MNPILLKPTSDNCSQVVVLGKVFANQAAETYWVSRQALSSVVSEMK